MSTYEYCEIEMKTLHDGFWRNTYQWQAHKATLSGSTVIITKTEEFHTGGSDDADRERRRKAYHQLIAQMTNAGWEVVSHDRNDWVSSMKRQVGGGNTDSMTNNSDNAAELLKQLDNLRSSGILTDDEFQTKVTEILKREVLKRG